MNLGDIVDRISRGVMRDDLADSYPDFVNEALREIQRRRSWLCMKQTAYFTIVNGASSVSLLADDDANDTNFKELTKGTSPVHLRNSDNVLTPCEVWTREKLLRRQARLISNSILYSVFMHPNLARRVSVPVFIQWEKGTPYLNVLFAADSDLPFSVSFYGYLDDLAEDSDTNDLTTQYPEMVIAKAKAIAFETINDPATADFEELFDKKFSEASAQDAYSALAGLDLRM